ncbi:MAG: TraB/GumN family protein [Paludibacteraceae bacterium]|nr:TraB/GumN family protein [Paludibacteraceae bacterium]
MRKVVMIVIGLMMVAMSYGQVLYEVSGQGLKKKSYIIGSNHILTAKALGGTQAFKWYNSCDIVVGEILIDESEVVAATMKYMRGEKRISEMLTLKEYGLLDSVMKADMGFGIEMVDIMRPALVENMWTEAVIEKLYPKETDEVGMDSYFQNVAALDGKKVMGLESVEQQMRLLIGLGNEEIQAKSLYEKCKAGKDVLREGLDSVINLYRQGDLYGLAKMSMKEMTQAEWTEKVDLRNAAWTEKLPAMMKEGSCFVVVGALHLYGPGGVVELLRKKGYKLKEVK